MWFSCQNICNLLDSLFLGRQFEFKSCSCFSIRHSDIYKYIYWNAYKVKKKFFVDPTNSCNEKTLVYKGILDFTNKYNDKTLVFKGILNPTNNCHVKTIVVKGILFKIAKIDFRKNKNFYFLGNTILFIKLISRTENYIFSSVS